VVSYLFALASIVSALVIARADFQMYSAFWGLGFVAICIELERWMRVAYVHHKLIMSARAKEEKLAVQVAAAVHAAQILGLNNQAHLAAKEQTLMRQIMGNVAHDMKTPLFSIRAELDSLKDITLTVCKQMFYANGNSHSHANIGSYASHGGGGSGHGVGNDPRTSIAYLKAETCEKIDTILSLIYFIVMGINRSQDYAKLTTNKALKPAMETVPISDVLRLVSTCMSHQQNGRMLVVHPMVRYPTF
jgi:signal transduction histidine kinase